MYCTNCGEIVKEGIVFCPHCGNKIDMEKLIPREIDKDKPTEKSISPKPGSNKKNPILAAFLSFLVPGTGQMYNREIRKGIIYLLISIFVPIVALSLLYENENMTIAIFANIIMIIYIVIYIYIIVDAYKIAKGQKVWGEDFWKKIIHI